MAKTKTDKLIVTNATALRVKYDNGGVRCLREIRRRLRFTSFSAGKPRKQKQYRRIKKLAWWIARRREAH